jgi:hypothetical protein
MQHSSLATQGEKVELFFSAQSLSNRDGAFGKSDPQLFLYTSSSINGPKGSLIGKTEHIQNNLAPSWRTAIDMFYIFEQHQYLLIQVMDVDNDGKHDLIGEAYLELAQIMAKGRQGHLIEIRKSGSFAGKVFIRFEKIAQELNEFMIDFCASSVKNVEWFSKSDPFLRIYRPVDAYLNSTTPTTIPDNMWILVQETEYVKDNLNPDFKPFTISGAKLCKNNMATPLKLEIWDHSKAGKHLQISTGYFSA